MDLIYSPLYEYPLGTTIDLTTIMQVTQEIHGIEDRSKEQAYTMVNMIEGKTVFPKTYQRIRVKG